MNLSKVFGQEVAEKYNVPAIDYEMKIATMNEVLDELEYEIAKQKNLAGITMSKEALSEATYNILQGKIMTLNSVKAMMEFIRKECISAWTREKVQQLKKQQH